MRTEGNSLPTSSFFAILFEKLRDYGLLIKFRLNLTVVFSAAFGFLMASPQVDAATLWCLCLGGFLVTAAANGLNEILEKDYDRLMKRTAIRPLAAGRMSTTEAILVSGICGAVGISILAIFFNELAATLGALSLVLYAFIYTPFKRLSPVAVFLGAIPGAMPPLIAWAAATGSLSTEAYILFGIQFLWQFPHFWAIGWMGYDDYKKAGFKLLPTHYDARNRSTAFNILACTIALCVYAFVPYYIGFAGWFSLISMLLLGFLFVAAAIQLYRTCTAKAALRVMLTSLLYLPLTQIALLLDKFFFI